MTAIFVGGPCSGLVAKTDGPQTVYLDVPVLPKDGAKAGKVSGVGFSRFSYKRMTIDGETYFVPDNWGKLQARRHLKFWMPVLHG